MSPRSFTHATYLALAAFAVALQFAGRLRRGAIAPLGRVVVWAMRLRTTQLGLLFAWWWLGWHFVTDR